MIEVAHPSNSSLLEPLLPAAQLKGMIDPARTALVIVDVQVDFASPQGAMGQAGLDLTAIPPALRRIESLIAAARAVRTPVVFVRVVSRPETDTDALKLLMARKGYPPESLAVCRDGTPGVDYHVVRPMPGDMEVAKPLFSAFVGSDMQGQLAQRGIDTLVVTGFTTDCCVDCTVRDAFHRNFNVFLVVDACAAYEKDLHYGALNGLGKNCALLVETNAVLEVWSV